MGSDRGSENQICEWHLPLLDQSKTMKKHRVKDRSYKIHTDSEKSSKSYAFQHFPDPAMYIDDYRKKHTVANAATDWKTADNLFPKITKHHETDCHFSQYIDIRVPERKICLTGLPQLKVPHHVPRRNVHDLRAGLPSDVPHLPHLKLNGVPTTMKERKLTNNNNEKEHHRKTKEKRKKVRLPYLKPNVDFGNNANYNYNFSVP